MAGGLLPRSNGGRRVRLAARRRGRSWAGSACWTATGTGLERSVMTSSRTSARRRWQCCSGWGWSAP